MTTTTFTRPRRRVSIEDTRPVWQEKPTPAGQAGKGLTLLVVLAVVLVPIYSVVLTSFSTQASVNIAGGLVLVPHGLTLAAYQQIFTNRLIIHSLLVSLGVTALGTAASMAATILCAYGLSRPRSFGHRFILITLVVTMFFNGGIIPTFLVVSKL